MSAASDLWVFGYGSLMWRPGFDHLERRPARLPGAHRALCVFSHVHRGTPEKPGLVLGLDHGGFCRGIAFCIEASKGGAAIAYLCARAKVTKGYPAGTRPGVLVDLPRKDVREACYIVDPS